MINQPRGKDQTVTYGTDSRLNVFQAINCLATIIQSLRDRVRQVPDGTTNRPRAHIRESYVTLGLPRGRGRGRKWGGKRWEAGPASMGWSCFLPKISACTILTSQLSCVS